VTFGPGITTYGIQVGMTVTWSGGTTNTVLAVPTSTTVTLTANGPTQTNLPATFSYPDRPRSFEFSLINPHHEDRFYLGGLNPDEPLRSDFLEAKWRITKEFVNINDIAGLQAWTVSTPSILFRNQGQPIGTASYREFEIRSNTAQVTSVGTPVQGYGIILLTTEHTAYRDSTTDLSAFRIRFRTTLTTALP
jgi:hypothetical protein